MLQQQKQEEINKIVDVCEENGIEYDINKLDFIEKDTGKVVDEETYTLLVIKEQQVRKLYGFYSMYRVYQYVEKAANKGAPIMDFYNKEIIGFILIDNQENKKSFVDFYKINRQP